MDIEHFKEEQIPLSAVLDKYKELQIIRLMALGFLSLALVLNVFYNIRNSSVLGIAFIIITCAVAFIAGFFAIMGLIHRKLQVLFLLVSGVAMLIAPMFKTVTTEFNPFMTLDFWIAMGFGLFFFLYIEYTHGFARYCKIGEMAIINKFEDFDFNTILKRYIITGLLFTLIVVVMSFIIAAFYLILAYEFITWQFALLVGTILGLIGSYILFGILRNSGKDTAICLGGGAGVFIVIDGLFTLLFILLYDSDKFRLLSIQFARSLELNSVYGIVFSESIVLLFIVVISTIIFARKDFSKVIKWGKEQRMKWQRVDTGGSKSLSTGERRPEMYTAGGAQPPSAGSGTSPPPGGRVPPGQRM